MKARWLAAPTLILAGTVWGAYSWLHTPAVGAVITNQPAAVKTEAAVLGAATRPPAWQTATFSSRIPTGLHLKSSNEQTAGPIFGAYLLTSTNPRMSDQIAVTVGSLGNGSLDEISSIKVRANQPQLYTTASRSYAPTGAIAYESTTNYETALFWQYGGRYVAVVASGSPVRSQDIEQDLAIVVTNWQWQ